MPNAKTDIRIVVSIISVITSIILYFLKDIYVQYKISITKPRMFAPEQFEQAFKDAIKVVSNTGNKIEKLRWFITGDKTKRAKKIVIVIDNIDRCHKQLAYELLLTVKSFLDNKNVIFVLPIDDNEIKKHIYNDEKDGNEFLRKLFNTTITIKKFSEDDLFDFTKKVVEKNNIELSNEIISLISQEFSNSPRKIIQFLNILQTEILLINAQEKSDNIPNNIISKNLPFLTKILLIREEWSDIFEKLKENTHFLTKIEYLIISGTSQEKKIEDMLLSTQQINFFSRTRHITSDNIDVFINNKGFFSDISKEITDYVISNNWPRLKKKLESKEINFDKLLEYISRKFEIDVIQRGLFKTTGFNIISLLFDIVEDEIYKEQLNKYYYNDSKYFGSINSKLNSIEIYEYIFEFKKTVLLQFIKQNKDKNKILLKQVVKAINNSKDDNIEFMVEFVSTFKSNYDILEEIKERFSELIENDQNSFMNFEKYFDNEDIIKSLLNHKLINNLIDKIGDTTAEQNEIKINVINKYLTIVGLNKVLFDKYLNNIQNNIKNANDFVQLLFLFNAYKPVLKELKEPSQLNNVFSILNDKNNNLWMQYASKWNDDLYIDVLKIFLEIITDYYIKYNGEKEEPVTWLNNYLSRNENKEIILKINELLVDIIEEIEIKNWVFADQLINKFNDTLTEWEDKKEIAKNLNSMLIFTEENIGLNDNQINSILTIYINEIENNKEIELWLNNILENAIIKDRFIKVTNQLPLEKKIKVISIIKELDKNTYNEFVFGILRKVDSENLKDIYDKLIGLRVNKDLINLFVEQKLIELRNGTNENLIKSYTNAVVDCKINNKEILNLIISIIKPYLSSNNIENKYFAIHILDNIDIPKDKKVLIKELLNDIADDEFLDIEKEMFEKVKKKYQ